MIRMTTAVYSYGNTPGVNLQGDGSTSTFSFDITKAPFNMNVSGNSPSAAKFIDPFTGEYTDAEISHDRLTLTFSAPLPVGGTNVSVQLLFDGA